MEDRGAAGYKSPDCGAAGSRPRDCGAAGALPKDCGGQAFPLGANEYAGHGPVSGMTLRDYFAAKAMQALVASVGQHSASGAGGSAMYGSPAIHARSAYAYADAMLAERAK